MRDLLGHYKILDRVGAGGIGDVYRARDTRLGRTVAIKIASPTIAGSPDLRERFLRDARASAGLSHPNIAELSEVGDDEGVPFLVFEYVPGETLSTVLGGRPLNPRRALNFAIQIADALADAHALGVSHLDLKPDNIIVTPKGNAKILDFGLTAWTDGGAARKAAAHMADAATTPAEPARTRTIPYLSPEQARGEESDHRSDIFTLGTILFEMLTGRLPFAAPTPAAQISHIIQDQTPTLRERNGALPVSLDRILAGMMNKSAEERWQSAAMVAAELRDVATVLDVRRGTDEPVVVPRKSAPRRAGWAIAALMLLALAVVVWLVVQAR